MTELVLRNDCFETEFPSLVREILTSATNNNQLFAQITKDGFCTVAYTKYLYAWHYDTENASMPHAFKLTMPSTGLQYHSSQICIYKKGLKKTPSILCVSPEGTLRHWAHIDKPHKDHPLELNNEVAHSLVIFDEQNHVHRFVLTTTTGSYFFIEVFHDEDKKEHLVARLLDLGSNVSIQRRMTILLLGSSVATRENVLQIRAITNQLCEPDAELMTLYHKSIRIYSVNETRLIFELAISEVINDGLGRTLGMTLSRDLKYNLLDAIVYNRGILMILAVSTPPQEQLDFYLVYVSEKSIKNRRPVEYIFQIDVPEHLAILTPFHESFLPKVSLHVPNADECAIVFPRFVLLISSIANSNRSVIREEFDDFLLGVATRNGLCHLILKETGICALRRLPRLFDLSFWKKYRLHLQKPSGDFLGRDFEHLQQAFFTFCSKDLDKAGIQTEKFASFNELTFSNIVVLFLKRFLNAAPVNDSRWGFGGDGSNYGQVDKKVVIMSQLREKLAFYRMFFLYLCTFNLMKKLDVALSDQGEKTARTLLVEFGEKLLSMIECFDWVACDECPIVENAIGQLSRRFTSQFDHPNNPQLTSFDHFFKEISAFEEFIPELVKCESVELEQFGQDNKARIKIVAEVGQVLKRVADAVKRARQAEWSAKPSSGALTWINQPRSMKYFIQHLNMAFSVVARQPTTEGTDEELSWSDILLSTECLARLVLSEQDHCQRNNSQIIAKFYEIGQIDLALELAEDFKDFTALIRHSHLALDDTKRQEYLQSLKERFKADNFDMCLYEYYRKNGMFEYLLEERGERVDDFLSHHENIGWIRNVESHRYEKARAILKNLVYEAKTAEKKATILALGKLCALCEDKVDPMVVAYFSDALTILEHQEAIDSVIAKRVNPTNRPLTPQEIINANLEEKSCSGFVKALLVVAHLFSSPVEQNTEHETKKLVRQVYSEIFAVDSWKEFNAHNADQFKLKADQTAVSSVLFRLSEMNLTPDLKNVLLPDIEHLNKMVDLDAGHQKALKAYLFSELLAFKFYETDKQERMET